MIKLRFDFKWLVSLIFSLPGLISSFLNLIVSHNLFVFSIVLCALGFIIGVTFFILDVIKYPGLFNVGRAAIDAGISGVWHNGDCAEIIEKKHAKLKSVSDIRILVVSGEILIEKLKGFIDKNSADKNVSIKILIATPDTDFIRELETIEETPGLVESNQKKLLTYCTDIRQKGGNIFVRRYNTQARNALVLIDKTWGWLTLYLPRNTDKDTISFEMNSSNNVLISECIAHFDAVWNIAKEEKLV